MDINGNNTRNPFDQNLNTTDDADFTRVDVTDAITDNQQLATKLYVDNNSGGNMTYTGTQPATNYIYKASSSNGEDATNSTITDDGTNCTVSATNGITANKVAITAGTNQQYLMADGSLLEASAQNGNANFYLYNNVNGLSVPPPASGQVTYNASTLAATTFVYISHLTRDNIDIDVFFTLITTLDDLYIQDQSNSVNFAKFNITGAPALNPNNYITIPVSQVQFGGNGNASFGVNHDILVSFFSNLQEVNTRLTTLEQKTISQSATVSNTTFNGTLRCSSLGHVGAGNDINIGISGTQFIRLGTEGIFLNSNLANLNGVNIITATSFAKSGGLVTEFLKANGTVDSNTYLTNTFSTFGQFSYYGTTPTASSFNMASGSITNIGGSFVVITSANTNFLTKQYRVRSTPSSSGDGQSSGWQGTSASPLVYISQGFKRIYSFSIEDTAGTATRSMIGLTQSSTVPSLNSTLTVQSLTIHSCCIMQELNETVFSFYTRGTSGFVKTATSISCVAPFDKWYVLTIENQPNSADITMTLTAYSSSGSTTVTNTFTAGLTTTPSLTATNNVLLLRSMAVIGGINGSAQLGIGVVKMYNV